MRTAAQRADRPRAFPQGLGAPAAFSERPRPPWGEGAPPPSPGAAWGRGGAAWGRGQAGKTAPRPPARARSASSPEFLRELRSPRGSEPALWTFGSAPGGRARPQVGWARRWGAGGAEGALVGRLLCGAGKVGVKTRKPEPRASAQRASSGGTGTAPPGGFPPASGRGCRGGSWEGFPSRGSAGPAQRGLLPAPAWQARERGSGVSGERNAPFKSLSAPATHLATHRELHGFPVASSFQGPGRSHPWAYRPGPGRPAEPGLRGCGWFRGRENRRLLVSTVGSSSVLNTGQFLVA